MHHKASLIPIEDLRPHPKNYRKHGQDQLEHIVRSIQDHGLYRNIVVANDGTILAGHGVYEACKSLGMASVPAIRLEIGPDDPKALKVVTGDNEISKLAEVDDRLLSELLRDIAQADNLLGTGFDKDQLANLVYVTRHESEIADFDAAREWAGLPSYDEEEPAKAEELLLVVKFKSREDRDAFIAAKDIKVGDTRGDRKWTTTFPYQERHDLRSVKFEQ